MQSRFNTFVSRIRPSPGQLKIAKAELDFLDEHLAPESEGNAGVKLIKTLRSGSYAKNTLLRRHDTGDFDADLALYFEVEESKTTVPNLLDEVHARLARVYKGRTKRPPHFDRSGKSAVRVLFRNPPKINLDVVPIIRIEHATVPNYGAIPRADGELRQTSVTEHVRFVTDRNQRENGVSFNRLVMLMKWWRDHTLPEPQRSKLSSFALELLVGHAFDRMADDLDGDWFADLLRVAGFVLRHRLREPVSFGAVQAASGAAVETVRILDPVNTTNNVAREWSESDRDGVLDALARLCDHLSDAQLEAQAGHEKAARQFLDEVLHNFSNWSEDD